MGKVKGAQTGLVEHNTQLGARSGNVKAPQIQGPAYAGKNNAAGPGKKPSM